MKGKISLKEFILGVKEELKEASVEGSRNPFLELSQVELEAEFGLDAKASAEGGFKFLVRVGGETSASQLHKVKLIFSPIRESVAFEVSSSHSTDHLPNMSTASLPTEASGPFSHGPYFLQTPEVRISPVIDIDKIVDKVMQKSRAIKKRGTSSDEEGE